MSRTQVLLCLFGISAFFFNNAEARSARRLEAEGIIGGANAKDGQFPYQISLEVLGQSLCGGSILSEDFVITAAHCVIDKDGSFMNYPLKVVAGISDLTSMAKSRVAIDVAKVFVPKEYDPTLALEKKRSTGDIAILKLNKKIDIKGNSKLGKVQLPKKGETYEGKKAVISGFGLNKVDVVEDPETGGYKEINGKSFKKMRFAEANVLSHDDCNEIYSPVLPVDETHICAALVQHDKNLPEGVCSGDSGGPLVYEGAQIGVVSTSPLGCREDGVPAVYTRVSDYLDFISKVVNGKTDSSIRSTTLRILP